MNTQLNHVLEVSDLPEVEHKLPCIRFLMADQTRAFAGQALDLLMLQATRQQKRKSTYEYLHPVILSFGQ